MIVPDASVVLEMLSRGPAAAEVESRIIASSPILCAPHLLDLEVIQGLRGFCLGRLMTANDAELALELYERLPIERYSTTTILWRVWAERHNLTAYDAAYLALTESLGGTLLTRDKGLAAQARKRRLTVQLI